MEATYDRNGFTCGFMLHKENPYNAGIRQCVQVDYTPSEYYNSEWKNSRPAGPGVTS